MCKLTHGSDFGQRPNSRFWNVLATRLLNAFLVVLLLPNIRNGTEADAHNQAQKAHTHTDCIEAVTLTKDKGECSVEEEAQPVEIPIVNGGADYDELGAEEPERPSKRDSKEIFDAPLLHVFRDVDVALAVVTLAFMLDSPGKKYAVSGLAAVYQ